MNRSCTVSGAISNASRWPPLISSPVIRSWTKSSIGPDLRASSHTRSSQRLVRIVLRDLRTCSGLGRGAPLPNEPDILAFMRSRKLAMALPPPGVEGVGADQVRQVLGLLQSEAA